MRRGAAIIVIIGLCLAALILFERKMSGDIQRVDGLLYKARNRQPVAADVETVEALEKELGAEVLCSLAMLVMSIVGVLLLALLFVQVSGRRVRIDFAAPLPNDDFALIGRLAVRDQYRFQYGVITLLAMMTAVALVCSAVVYPIK